MIVTTGRRVETRPKRNPLRNMTDRSIGEGPRFRRDERHPAI